MKFLILSTLFLSLPTFAQFDHLSSLEKYLLEIQYKNEILYGSKKKKAPFEPKKECVERFQKSKSYWEKDSRNGKKLLLEGEMEKAFSRSDIETMGTKNIHGLKTKVRGTDKYLPGGYSTGGGYSFPHQYPGCESFFEEEMQVVDVGEKKCRQVKFTFPEVKEVVYYQVYCQDSTNLRINFDPENKFDPSEIRKKGVDCPHCP